MEPLATDQRPPPRGLTILENQVSTEIMTGRLRLGLGATAPQHPHYFGGLRTDQARGGKFIIDAALIDSWLSTCRRRCKSEVARGSS